MALATPIDGERLVYEASWLGILAGTAKAELHLQDGAWVASVRTQSAGWVASIYPVDDLVTGTWTESGSLAYATRFREGRFQQDQQVTFGPSEISVSRHQLIEGAWRDWTDVYAVPSGLLDPVAAVYRLREAWSGTLQFDAFSGRKRVPVRATGLGEHAVQNILGVATEKVDVRAGYDGKMNPWMAVWFGTDAARVPVRAVVETRGGQVTVELVERSVVP